MKMKSVYLRPTNVSDSGRRFGSDRKIDPDTQIDIAFIFYLFISFFFSFSDSDKQKN